MDIRFWGTTHGIALALTCIVGWLGGPWFGLFMAVAAAFVSFLVTLWWAQEFEDWWDDFKESRRMLLIGIPAALLTPTIGLVLGLALR